MSDNFEFDDNDDVLLEAFCTPPSENTSPEKCLNEGNDAIPLKRLKPNENSRESTSPIIQFSHKLNKTAQSSTPIRSSTLPNAAKRIFPGPAGILLDGNQTDICSQDTSFFQDGPWEEMSKDFKISSSLHLFDKFNIAWIKKEATANKFVDQKAPFLAGILLSLEVSEGHTQKSINITLRDITGSIQGTILQNLYGEYASHFTLGSVIVLVQFGVLSCTCDKCDNHHLTITPKNLSALYTGKEKIIIKQVDPDKILKDYCQRKKELELLGTHKNLSRLNNPNSPTMSNTNSNRCTLNTRKMGFQSHSISRNILSPHILNRTVKNSEDTLQNSLSGTSQTFILPKVRTIEKSNAETAVVKEVHETKGPENINNSSSPAAPTRLFTFKKVSTSPKVKVHESNCSPLSNFSTVTISQCSLSSQNSILNFGQVDYNKTKIIDKNVDSVKIGNGQLSIKVDKVEHEKIWKDLLKDVDVNSFFDEF